MLADEVRLCYPFRHGSGPQGYSPGDLSFSLPLSPPCSVCMFRSASVHTSVFIDMCAQERGG